MLKDLDPDRLVKQAEEALKQRDDLSAATYLEQAGFEYLENGDYWKARETFIKLFSVWSEAKLVGRILTLTEQVVLLFKEVKAFEEAGIVSMIAANQAFHNNLVIESAELYEDAARLFEMDGNIENRGIVAANLARAAECYGSTGKSNRAEILLIRAVMAALKVDQELLELEGVGWNAIKRGNFSEAAEIFKSVSNAFERGVSEINIVISSQKIGKLTVNSHAKLYHFAALYALLSALCYCRVEDEANISEALIKARKASQESLECMIFVLKSGEVDREDKWRASLDLLIHIISYFLMGVPWEANALYDKTSILFGKNPENKEIMNTCELIIDARIPEAVEQISYLKLGGLNAIKPILNEQLRNKFGIK